MTAPSARPGLVEELAALLRNRLYDGRYATGSVLSQAATAVELGVSRTPLREVFRLLAAEGLLRPDPAGAIVIGMDLQRWRTAIPLRAALDAVAAELCAAAVAAEPAGPTARELRTTDPTVQAARIGADEQHFHLTLLRVSGNEFVQEQTALVRRTTVLAAPLLAGVSALRCTDDHRAILAAVLAGDPEVGQLARAHQHQLAAALSP